jgi:hypothetical protein
MGIRHEAKPSCNNILKILRKIKEAKNQLHLPEGGGPTRTALISKIRLCDVLLRELRAIHRELELSRASRVTGHRSHVLTTPRSRHLAGPRGNAAHRPPTPSMRAELK